MALFSTTAATANISNLKKVKYEPFQGGFEFKSYGDYATAFGNNAIRPEKKWKGQDGAWLRDDRLNARGTWVRAAHKITLNKWPGRFLPFGQVDDYYKLVHVWVIGRKHEIRWIHGAHYLVEDLWEGFEDGFFKFGDLIASTELTNLLKDLNTGICDYAITRFYELLYGIYSKAPLKGASAYVFDRNFVVHEQEVIAHDIYELYKDSPNPANVEALAEASIIFNRQDFWLNTGKTIDPTGIFIPVFPILYNSDFTNRSTRFGEEARIQVPLAILYLTKYFVQDAMFKNTRFAKELIKGETGSYFSHSYIIYNAYRVAHNKVLKVFLKWFEF